VADDKPPADDAGKVDDALQPYVEVPTFSEFLLLQDLQAALSRRLRRLAGLLRHGERPGYGKLAAFSASARLSSRSVRRPAPRAIYWCATANAATRSPAALGRHRLC